MVAGNKYIRQDERIVGILSNGEFRFAIPRPNLDLFAGPIPIEKLKFVKSGHSVLPRRLHRFKVKGTAPNGKAHPGLDRTGLAQQVATEKNTVAASCILHKKQTPFPENPRQRLFAYLSSTPFTSVRDFGLENQLARSIASLMTTGFGTSEFFSSQMPIRRTIRSTVPRR